MGNVNTHRSTWLASYFVRRMGSRHPCVLPDQDGRCKTLDAAADGYMRGEAAVAPLLAAGRGDGVRAACHLAAGARGLAGTAVNQDGRSSSLTVSGACPGTPALSVPAVMSEGSPRPMPSAPLHAAAPSHTLVAT